MSADFESPFLDRDTPIWPPDDEHETPPAEMSSPFDNLFAEAESPFLQGEGEEAESPFVSAESEEMEYAADDPSLFDPRELEEEAAPEWERESDDDADPESESESEYEHFAAYDGGSNGAGDLEGEFVLLDENEEPEESDETEGEQGAQFILLGQESEYADESELPGDSFPIMTRILWPALGFPAVVTPNGTPTKEATLDVDATRCLTILVLTNTPAFPAAEVAKRLRVVPWAQRGRRFLAEGKGSFAPSDIVVRSDAVTKLTLTQPKDATQQLIGFGEGAGRTNTIIVNLAKKVREIYKGWGMEHLHEIRVSEAATARMGTGQFHVFFNNLQKGENAPSDEMTLLINLGKRRREAEANPKLSKILPAPAEEYQYEFGSIHKPYSAKRAQKRRVEVLHPVFIRKTASPRLRLGHITDLHVDVRQDVYEFNLAAGLKNKKVAPHSFNNWNESVRQIYAAAKRDTDGLLLTGDLIDYGRGHAGIGVSTMLGQNEFYHRDRNWLLFYDMLVAENRYTVPVYTSLGNHDWRVNPYPPFAVAGAPGPATMVNDYDCLSRDKLEEIIRVAHGNGHEAKYGYDPKWRSLDLVDVVKMVNAARRQETRLDAKGLPTETSIESVLWYLLTINPFLDYLWALPSKHRLLMLDWAQYEGIFFKKIENGVEKDYGWTPSGLSEAADPGPKAIDSLTSEQRLMVEHFVKIKSPAKVIGMHVPPVGPWNDWGDDDLRQGFKQYKRAETRGPKNYVLRKNGKDIAVNGHPLFAVRPKKGPAGHLAGMDADYNTLMKHREWLIRTLADPGAGVRLVLSGHIHRNGRYGIRVGTKADGSIVEGELLLRSLEPKEVQGAAAPAISTATKDFLAPLYVNTTSAGPRGNNHPTEGKHLNVDPGFAYVELMANGEIRAVSFRRPVNAKKASCDVGKARTAKKLPAFAF